VHVRPHLSLSDSRTINPATLGGGFQHGKHLPFDPDNPPPLCNLFVSMLQRLGLKID